MVICFLDVLDIGDYIIPNLMTVAAAFLMALGGLHVLGEWSFYALITFAIGVVWISQAPAIALRKRVRDLELKLISKSSIDGV